jgi:hypothetical protein
MSHHTWILRNPTYDSLPFVSNHSLTGTGSTSASRPTLLVSFGNKPSLWHSHSLCQLGFPQTLIPTGFGKRPWQKIQQSLVTTGHTFAWLPWILLLGMESNSWNATGGGWLSRLLVSPPKYDGINRIQCNTVHFVTDSTDFLALHWRRLAARQQIVPRMESTL